VISELVETKQLNLSPENLDVVSTWSKEEIKSFISDVEAAMQNGIKIDLPVAHHFSKSVYAREMTVPKGVMLVGKIHKHQNLNILSKGSVTVLSIDGLVKVSAPFTFVGSPGAKRLIYAHEDTVWTTIHGTDEKDIEKIEEQFIAKNYEEVQITHEEVKPCLG
jgi:hypothetical protein